MNQNYEKLILLDFDHTVFNTTKYKNKLKQVFAEKFDIDPETFSKHREYVKQCCVVVDFDNFVESFKEVDSMKLHYTMEGVLREHASEWIFTDVIPFMEQHKDEYEIKLLTHGDKEQQEEKITHSNLPHYIDWIISTSSKDEAIADLVYKYEEIHFFDDKAKNIDNVKQAFPKITTYFVQRPEDKPYADQPSSCGCDDFVVEGLKII
jgi:FMN phosphatase YigB (HAD superfamily)